MSNEIPQCSKCHVPIRFEPEQHAEDWEDGVDLCNTCAYDELVDWRDWARRLRTLSDKFTHPAQASRLWTQTELLEVMSIVNEKDLIENAAEAVERIDADELEIHAEKTFLIAKIMAYANAAVKAQEAWEHYVDTRDDLQWLQRCEARDKHWTELELLIMGKRRS